MINKRRNKENPDSMKKIDRKQALKKIGITALTATSLIFLEPKVAAADSTKSPARAPRRGR